MAGSGNSDAQMPKDPALREAIEAIRELRKAYKHLFKSGQKRQRWRRCDKAHKVAVQALESADLIARIDKKTHELHFAGNGAPAEARAILRGADGTIINFEKRLARGAGFHNKELREFMHRAPRMLKRAAGKNGALLPHVTSTADLTKHLGEVYDFAHDVMFDPLRGKDIKHSERGYALKQIMRRLYLVASIVSNADAGRVFNYSYASGLGSAYVRRPKKLPAEVRLLPRGIQTPRPGNP